MTLVIFGLALVFGGATSQGHASDALVELACLPLLAVALMRLATQPRTRHARFALALLALILALPLLQLVPFPPVLWTHFPGRGSVVEVFAFIDRPLPWWPVSLDPSATLGSFLSVLPATAVFLAVLSTDVRDRRTMTLGLVGFAILTVVVGLAQLAQGPGSPLRFYAITNFDSSVGFFANRNHYAALLCAALPLALAWTIHSAGISGPERRIRGPVFGAVSVLLLLGAAMSLSRAGIVLATLALGSGILLLDFGDARESRKAVGRLMVVIAVVAVLMIANYALSGLLSRFATSGIDDFRFLIWSITREAISSVFPLGAGFGTFQPLYRAFDRPEALSNAFVNRAHNDWLELVLEAGLPAILLMLAFCAWFGMSVWRAWRGHASEETRLDVKLVRAATLSIAVLLLHSIVDYPLRTIAGQSVFAFLCALLVVPVCRMEKPPARRRRRPSRVHRPAPSDLRPAPRPTAPAPPRDRKSLNWTD
jgi:O-antigen ligase